MTKARAIELLKENLFCCNFEECNNAWDCDECVDAFNMAIEALEQEPKRGKWVHGKEVSREYIGDTCVAIKYEDWHCSSCKMVVKESYKPNWNYCPHCGVDMRGDEE